MRLQGNWYLQGGGLLAYCGVVDHPMVLAEGERIAARAERRSQLWKWAEPEWAEPEWAEPGRAEPE